MSEIHIKLLMSSSSSDDINDREACARALLDLIRPIEKLADDVQLGSVSLNEAQDKLKRLIETL
jgi:hypothetical protein